LKFMALSPKRHKTRLLRRCRQRSKISLKSKKKASLETVSKELSHRALKIGTSNPSSQIQLQKSQVTKLKNQSKKRLRKFMRLTRNL
jgi:hypothetical protein